MSKSKNDSITVIKNDKNKIVKTTQFPYIVLHGCNTEKSKYTQKLANNQNVVVYAQNGFASFSTQHDEYVKNK